MCIHNQVVQEKPVTALVKLPEDKEILLRQHFDFEVPEHCFQELKPCTFFNNDLTVDRTLLGTDVLGTTVIMVRAEPPASRA